MAASSRFAYLPVAPTKDMDYSKQAVEVPGTKRPGQSAHYRGSAYPFMTLESPNVFTNLVEIFDEGLLRANGGPFLGHRPVISTNPLKHANYHVWQSWPEVDARRRNLGSGIHKLFETGVLGGGDLPTVGIWCKNCPNWQVVDFSLHAYGKVGVSLYDTLGKDSAEFIINHAELTIIFAAPQHLPALLKLAPKCPQLRMIVAMDPLDSETRNVLDAWGETVNVQIKEIAELEEFGRANPHEVIPATAETIASICYTSGTTGVPKGAVLSHGTMAQGVFAYLWQFKMTKDNVLMSFLPLAHIYERTMELIAVSMGAQIGYTTGDPQNLLEDLAILKPHFYPTVPRVLNRIYQAAMAAGAAPGLKGALFRRAVATKLYNLRTNGSFFHAFYDKLVFSKIAGVLGGRVRMLTSGSAPISATVMDFLKISVLAEVIEGSLFMYGMTENCGSFTRTWYFDPKSSGTVGAPHPNCEVKLVDVPAMGYTADDKPYPRGEICMRGPQMFSSYYKDPKKTAEAVDEEGWLHTGDVGLLDDALRLKVIDRVKNIMKLAQGEYVALEHVESIYGGHPLVAQLYVHGDSLQSYLIGVAVPDAVHFSALVSRVRGKNISPEDVAALSEATKDPQIAVAFLADLQKQAQKHKLKGFEQLKRIHLTMEAMTTENGCLTPTLKIRRKEAYEYFKLPLDSLYTLGDPNGSIMKL